MHLSISKQSLKQNIKDNLEFPVHTFRGFKIGEKDMQISTCRYFFKKFKNNVKKQIESVRIGKIEKLSIFKKSKFWKVQIAIIYSSL